jgi:hypothetical protein
MPNTTIVDSSTYNHSLTITGTPVLSSKLPYPVNGQPRNPLSKGGSIYFDGNSHIAIPINNTTNYGTGDFTLEFWVYLFNNNVDYSFVSSGFSIYRSGTTQKIHIDYRSTNNVLTPDSTSDMANRWTHVAATRQSGTLRLFVDGILLKTQTGDATNYTSPGDGRIGEGQLGGSRLVGYLAGFHSIMGTCLYTANFTPLNTLPTIHANTKLMFRGTNVEIFDAVGQTAIYMNGGVSLVSSGTRKYGNGAISFNGTTGYLRVPNGPGLVLGTGQFTAETWIYPAAVSGSNRGIFGQGAAASSQFGARISNAGTISMWVGGTGNLLTGTTVLSINTWYHIALVRTSSHVKLFINGNEELSTTNGLSYNITGADLVVGRTFTDTNGEYFSGYIDDTRLTKTVARYNSTFTAPTERFAVL